MPNPITPRRRITNVAANDGALTWRTLRDAAEQRHLIRSIAVLVTYADATTRWVAKDDLARYRYRAPVAAAPRGFV